MPRSRITAQERLRAVARLMRVPYEQVVWHELRAHHVEHAAVHLSDDTCGYGPLRPARAERARGRR